MNSAPECYSARFNRGGRSPGGVVESGPSPCYERSLRLNTPNGHGQRHSEPHGHQWLWTPPRVDGVAPARSPGVRRDGPFDVELQPVSGVRRPTWRFSGSLVRRLLTFPWFPLRWKAFSQDAYFLRFPLRLGLEAAGITYPFVKKAVISAFKKELNGSPCGSSMESTILASQVVRWSAAIARHATGT